MKNHILPLILIFSANLSGQEIITLEYDNRGLDYIKPEIKVEDYSSDEYKFKNISIPTLQVFLPKVNSKLFIAMVVCPGGGMKSNAFSMRVWT